MGKKQNTLALRGVTTCLVFWGNDEEGGKKQVPCVKNTPA